MNTAAHQPVLSIAMFFHWNILYRCRIYADCIRARASGRRGSPRRDARWRAVGSLNRRLTGLLRENSRERGSV
jgi:hypothetical protein